jgi:Ca2+-binding EF-hand superfamily protein
MAHLHMSHQQVVSKQRTRSQHSKMDTYRVTKSRIGTVLLTGDELAVAAESTTQGGKKRIDGLYLPSGDKVERASVQHNIEDSMAGDEEAQAILEASTEAERLQYDELFDFFDIDKDRTWGSIEFAQRMSDIGCATTVECASNLLYFAGVRDIDRITYNDFVQMMPKLKAFRILLEKDVLRVFAEKDTRGRGWITCKALRQVLSTIAGPEGMDPQHLERLVKLADRERTGMITYAFFVRALFGTPPLIEYKPPSRGSALLSHVCLCGGKAVRDDEDDEPGTI